MFKSDHIIKGVILILLGYLANAFMSVCAKTLPSNVPTITVVYFQFLVAALLTLGMSWKEGFHTLKTERLNLLLLRCSTGILSSVALFFTIKYIPLVNAVLLQFTYPLFLPIVVWIWMRHVIPKKVWIGIIIGFVGVLFILKPDAKIFHPAALIGLLGGILSSMSIISVALLKRTEPTNRILFYTFFPGFLVLTPVAFQYIAGYSWLTYAALIGVGLCMYLAQMLITSSFRYGKASLLAPFSYSTVAFSGLLGWFFWRDIPDWVSFVGIVLVCIGGIVTIVLEQRARLLTGLPSTDEKDDVKAAI